MYHVYYFIRSIKILHRLYNYQYTCFVKIEIILKFSFFRNFPTSLLLFVVSYEYIQNKNRIHDIQEIVFLQSFLQNIDFFSENKNNISK